MNENKRISNKLISDDQVEDLIKSFRVRNNSHTSDISKNIQRKQPIAPQSTRIPTKPSGSGNVADRSDSTSVRRSRFNQHNARNNSPSNDWNHLQFDDRNHSQPNERNIQPNTSSKNKPKSKKSVFTPVKAAALVLGIILLSWLLPAGNMINISSASVSSKDRSSFFEASSDNLLSDALSAIHTIPKTYTLEMCDYLTPAPDPSNFSKIEDDKRKNFDGTPIDFYKDETIEVRCWREKTKYGIITYAEVWIAHPSQFRRTIVDNVISKKHKDFPENIFRKTNGILGMSGDYCAFRPYGIEIQYGNLLRDKVGSHLTPKMDVLVYDVNGNFSVYESTKEFFNTDVYKNGEIIHTFAFGPMIIDNYKVSSRKDKLYQYQNGRPWESYPRAAVCQFDYDKHYLLCRLGKNGSNLETFATEIQKKGVRLAYALDGGQTGTIMFNKKVINEPAYTGTREMSDIFFFATAVPNEQT